MVLIARHPNFIERYKRKGDRSNTNFTWRNPRLGK